MIKLLLNSTLSLIVAACAFGDGSIEIGKEFTVKKDKSASGAGVKVTMRGAGRSQNVSGGDTIYCSIDLTADGKTNKLSLDVGESVSAGKNSLKLIKVDMTASPKAADPWENNACSFVVTKAGE